VSCKACEAFQRSAYTAFFRWRNATIEVRACDEHRAEVFDALRKALPYDTSIPYEVVDRAPEVSGE
jgi:hypothetical protein